MDVDWLRSAACNVAYTMQATAFPGCGATHEMMRRDAVVNFCHALGAPIHHDSSYEDMSIVAMTWAIAHLDELLAAFAAKRMENPHGE